MGWILFSRGSRLTTPNYFLIILDGELFVVTGFCTSWAGVVSRPSIRLVRLVLPAGLSVLSSSFLMLFSSSLSLAGVFLSLSLGIP